MAIRARAEQVKAHVPRIGRQRIRLRGCRHGRGRGARHARDETMYDSASVMAAPTTVARRADQACPGAMRAGGEEISAVYQRVDADAYVVGDWGS